MRSRAEWALRAALLVALGALIWRGARPLEPPSLVTTSRGGLERALIDATRRPLAALDATLDSIPRREQRDWLRAVRATGTRVAWTADVAPIAIAASAVPEPEGRIRVTFAGADGSSARLADALGSIDTVELRTVPSTRLLRTASGVISAEARGIRAFVEAPAPASVRRVLMFASAGWESKFVVAALEEAGWQVDARLRVAPGVETRQGGSFALDTARYSTAIALDGAATAHAVAIERFVGSGGGVVLGAAATRLPAFSRITAGVAGRRLTTGPRGGLVLALRDDAVALEEQAGGAVVAARRSGRGRVVATGYNDTWRWRMRADTGLTAHRDWWTALVSAVAHTDSPPAREASGPSDPAPYAALAAALGPPSKLSREGRAQEHSWMPPAWLLFGVLLASLLGEVVSRRLRGLA